MSKLAACLEISSLEEFWLRYDIESKPLAVRYVGQTAYGKRHLYGEPESCKGAFSILVHGADWGRAPDSTLAACPIVQTAALMLLDATREPESYLLSFEFAGDVLRTYGPSFITSAQFIRDWYAAELAMIDGEVTCRP